MHIISSTLYVYKFYYKKIIKVFYQKVIIVS